VVGIINGGKVVLN